VPAAEPSKSPGNLQGVDADVRPYIGIDVARADLRMKMTGEAWLIGATVENDSLPVVPEAGLVNAASRPPTTRASTVTVTVFPSRMDSRRIIPNVRR
jgi:hypothetical protein